MGVLLRDGAREEGSLVLEQAVRECFDISGKKEEKNQMSKSGRQRQAGGTETVTPLPADTSTTVRR